MQFDPSHNSEIIAYYRTNYTTCPEDTNFFASWHFLTGFLHSVFIVQSPLVIFTGYCILKKTPQVMGSLKWAMLNVHFWSTYMDVLLCTLTIPYLIFPAIGGFPLGLLRWLGVPTPAQTYLTIISVGFMLNSISALFENRSSSFEVTRFRFTRTISRITFFMFNGLITAVCLYPIFDNIPNQHQAKMKLLKLFPCFHRDFFTSPVFILIIDDYWSCYLTIVLLAQATWIVSSIFFFIGCVTYHIFFSLSANYSQQTKKLQKMFFIGNVIQVSLPTVFWAIPAFFLVFTVFATYYNQALNNIFVAFVSLHGLTSMVTTLLIHRPYRDYLLSFFMTTSPKPFVPHSQYIN